MSNDEAVRHMVEYLGWIINGCDYQLDPNVRASVDRWIADDTDGS